MLQQKQKQPISNQMRTNILAELEQQFRKLSGQPLSINYCMRIIAKQYLKMQQPDKLSKENQEHILDMIQQSLNYSDKYIIEQTHITRFKKYKQIINQYALRELVKKHPEGFHVDPQLLNFSHKDIRKLIDKSVSQKVLKKIQGITNDQYDCFLFSRQIQIEHEIRQNQHKYFGMDFYLGICRQYNTKQKEEKEGSKESSKQGEAGMNISGGDINYQIPDFVKLKQQWIKRNTKK